ncbi:exodeoxyribonuclease III [Coralliovum pocilloporae]|uniref:exodeoxyribonuclease III n=1 Tax=Coralliovum pocilloporae TaxID=3066369 RepID=UPI0033073652
MPIRLVTWNINSVRLRAGLVEQLVADQNPDIICLQETKCADDKFPHSTFRKMGYEHIAIHGQKGYHGVATLSRIPFSEPEQKRDFCGKGDARHVATTHSVNGTTFTLHNFYVPAGGDEPDPAINDKFAHKLDFLDEMKSWLTGSETDQPSVLVGDLNIAPFEHDVWSHKQLLKVVSHTPVEVESLEAVRQAGNWVDLARKFIPETEKLYSWWSYRSKDWSKADKGRRLDHIWVTPHLEQSVSHFEVLRNARGWERPSDHAPIIVSLDL